MKWRLSFALAVCAGLAALTEVSAPLPSSQLPEEVVIAVFGPTGTGKTSFVNMASGSDFPIGTGLMSETSVVQISEQFELDGRKVRLVDTPGFDDSGTSDVDVLKTVAMYLASSYKDGHLLSGAVYLHRISDFRVGGVSARGFRMLQVLCGESALKNVAIVTNMWGEVAPEVGEAREAELASEDGFFKPALDKQAQLLRHNNTIESAHAILLRLIHNHPLPLSIQRDLVDESKDFDEIDTAASSIEN